MGICGSTEKVTGIISMKSLRVQKESSLCGDTESYRFDLNVDSFRLRGAYFEDCCLRLKCAELTLQSAVGSCDLTMKATNWDVAWQFSCFYSVRQLLEKQLMLELVQQHNKRLAVIRFSLYELARGPTHFSIAVNDNKATKCRLNFNIHIQQVTNVVVTPTVLRCVLESPPDAEFSVLLSIVHSKQVNSEPSASNTSLQWDFRECPESKVPSLSFPATISDIRAASLAVKVAVLESECTKVIGECWVSLPRLLKDQNFEAYQNETPYFQEKPTHLALKPEGISGHLDEDLLRKGKVVGSLKGNILISNLPFIWQMIAGVTTEHRIELQTVAVMDNSTGYNLKQKVKLSREVMDLELLYGQLNRCIRSGAQNNPFSLPDDIKAEQHIEALEEIVRILRKTTIGSIPCFTYSNAKELIHAQTVLLRLGEHLCFYCDQVNYSVRPFYFDCMAHLFRRHELDLGSLSPSTNDKRLFTVKLQLAHRYSSLLIRVLRFILPKVDSRSADQKVYHFIKLFMAIAYHRIPGFREKVINAIQQKMWADLPEWKRAEIQGDSNKDSIAMLNWKTLFYDYIPEVYDNHRLLAALNDTKWQKVIEKRSIVYFYFIDEWAQHMNKQFVVQHIP